MLKADDAELLGDGLDAIRLAFEVTDKFSAPRPFVEGEVTFQIAGPGVLIGDNPFLLGDSGGAGAVWIKAKPGSTGRINIQALHNDLGEKAAEINIRQSPKSRI